MSSSAARLSRTRRPIVKVARPDAWFWGAKLLTTALGEATSDYLVKLAHPVPAVLGGTLLLAVVITWQISAVRFMTWLYWSAVLAVAVVGTMAADVVHLQFGVPYALSTLMFAAAIALVFGLWRASETTVSIHSIVTRRREMFYWLAVITTFGFGTACGDFLASTLHLGYGLSGVLSSVAILIPLIAWARGGNEVVCFWAAYILTRPVGASFVDYLAKPAYASGLGWGEGPVVAVMGLTFLAVVAHMARRDQRLRRPGTAERAARLAPRPVRRRPTAGR